MAAYLSRGSLSRATGSTSMNIQSREVRLLVVLQGTGWAYMKNVLRATSHVAESFEGDYKGVFWDYTAIKVLTLEYVPGIKINNLEIIDARGYNRSLISSRVIEAYLIQILRTGFFHADPHPGNLDIDLDGELIYYDFGMMGEIKSFTKKRLLDIFYALYDKDAKKV
ncbi:hypothetical protein IFM89_030837, partial [Coptis chinensis]